MKRVIKFRAWDGKKMYSGPDDFYMKMNGECFGVFEGEIDEPICGQPILMQFTGLKDKNGKEIYEGDVVKEFDGLCKGIEYITIVEWENESSTYSFFKTSWVKEVIGNIYENPELVK